MLATEEIKRLLPLSGGKVKLELFKESNITGSYVRWLNDPDVVRYSNQRFKRHTQESCLKYFQSFEKADALFITVSEKETGTTVGTMTVYFNLQHETADIGIMIGDKNHWGKGLGKDAWATMLNFLINQCKFRKVTGGTLACNKGMIKIMQETGMQADGIRRLQEIVEDTPYDILHFAKFQTEII